MAIVIIGATVAGLALVTGGWYIGTYNTFMTAKQDMKTQWSNIKTEYQRRADLLMNLAATVKSFKKHEKDTLTEVIKARGGVFGPTKADEIKKMGQVDTIMQRLMLVFEQYPNLKSNEQHNILMNEVRITEDRINIARTDYNGTVRDYNLLVHRVPSNILANIHNFQDEVFFELQTPDAEKAPTLAL